MSSTRSPKSINAFAIDAFHVSMELYAVSESDAPGVRAAAIRKGRRSYETLARIRESLRLSSDDASAAEHMLSAIDARLEYLCSITFRRNQWRWRRREHKNPEMMRGELDLPRNLPERRSIPRWWRSYSIEFAGGPPMSHSRSRFVEE